MVAAYLDANYDRVSVRPFCSLTRWRRLTCTPRSLQFFASYTTLVLSSNYVTKRQSIKLLGEILLDRANYKVMTRYIANEANLKMMMNLLRDKSRNIQFEAFHVFKVRSLLQALPAQAAHCLKVTFNQVFVANPNKPPPIVAILARNKDKLISFLQDFHSDKEGVSTTLSLTPP